MAVGQRPASLDRYRDCDAAHHVIDLEIPFRAQRMAVMAIDAGGGDGAVRIDGLEILFASAAHNARNGCIRGAVEEFQPLSLKIGRGGVALIDR